MLEAQTHLYVEAEQKREEIKNDQTITLQELMEMQDTLPTGRIFAITDSIGAEWNEHRGFGPSLIADTNTVRDIYAEVQRTASDDLEGLSKILKRLSNLQSMKYVSALNLTDLNLTDTKSNPNIISKLNTTEEDLQAMKTELEKTLTTLTETIEQNGSVTLAEFQQIQRIEEYIEELKKLIAYHHSGTIVIEIIDTTLGEIEKARKIINSND